MVLQLRLDFQTFLIAGPSAENGVAFKTLNGRVVTIDAATKFVPSNSNTQCITDTFSVSNYFRCR